MAQIKQQERNGLDWKRKEKSSARERQHASRAFGKKKI
jgi:hypothetical protein